MRKLVNTIVSLQEKGKVNNVMKRNPKNTSKMQI